MPPVGQGKEGPAAARRGVRGAGGRGRGGETREIDVTNASCRAVEGRAGSSVSQRSLRRRTGKSSRLELIESSAVITTRDIEEARQRIQGVVKTTPCLMSRTFSNELRANAWFKYETLQLTGSFKVRGACNKIRCLTPAEVEAGGITASAGHH